LKKRKAMAHRALMTAALLGGFLFSGCTSWFGQAETPEQEAFRAMGRYVYLATPASNFANLAAPDASVLKVVCTLDEGVYNAFQDLSRTLKAGGDGLTAALSGAAAALASFSLEVIGQAAFPSSAADIVGKSVVWARVGASSAATMRAWRKGYLRPKLEAMVTQGLAPTPQDWSELQQRVDSVHQSIQGRCHPST